MISKVCFRRRNNGLTDVRNVKKERGDEGMKKRMKTY
jgi:hypothetical protein